MSLTVLGDSSNPFGGSTTPAFCRDPPLPADVRLMKQPLWNMTQQIARAAREFDRHTTEQVPKSAAKDNRKPIPLLLRQNKPRLVCLVCGMVRYSPSGVHPQCAQKQADVERVQVLKSAKKAENPNEKVAKPNASNLWQKKVCPKCHSRLHVRKLTCDCGHPFSFSG